MTRLTKLRRAVLSFLPRHVIGRVVLTADDQQVCSASYLWMTAGRTHQRSLQSALQTAEVKLQPGDVKLLKLSARDP